MNLATFFATALLCALLCACGDDAPQPPVADVGADKPAASAPPQEVTADDEPEEEFRVPDVWCGTGMRDRGHPLGVDPNTSFGEWSAWREAGSSGIFLRLRINFVNGSFATERQYRQLKNGEWETWSYAEEMARRKREALKPKQPKSKAK